MHCMNPLIITSIYVPWATIRTVPIATQVIPWLQCAAKFLAETCFLVHLITHMHGPEHTSILVLAYSKPYWCISSLKSGHSICSNLYTENLESLLFSAASHVPISTKLTIDLSLHWVLPLQLIKCTQDCKHTILRTTNPLATNDDCLVMCYQNCSKNFMGSLHACRHMHHIPLHVNRSFLLTQPFARSNSYFYSFIPNVISVWNSLPESVVCVPSLSVFKQPLHHFFL